MNKGVVVSTLVMDQEKYSRIHRGEWDTTVCENIHEQSLDLVTTDHYLKMPVEPAALNFHKLQWSFLQL
jgi:hypothetical protein